MTRFDGSQVSRGVTAEDLRQADDSSEPRVLVVVLNWNRPQETIQCMESVVRLRYGSCSYLLIDNGSRTEVIGLLVHWIRSLGLPWQRLSAEGRDDNPLGAGELGLLCTGQNLGYAGGNNVGLRLALMWGFDWVLILNNDATVPTDYLVRLLDVTRHSSRPGLVGSRHRPAIESETPLYAGGRLLYGLGVYALWRWRGRRGVAAVNFVPGCAVLINAQLLRDVGLFDERYFLYSEDVDLSYRAKRMGWDLLVNLDVESMQEVSKSLGGPHSAAYYYYVTRNTFLFIRDQLTGLTRLSSFACLGLQTVLRCAIWALSANWACVVATMVGFTDFARGRFGPAPDNFHPGVRG